MYLSSHNIVELLEVEDEELLELLLLPEEEEEDDDDNESSSVELEDVLDASDGLI